MLTINCYKKLLLCLLLSNNEVWLGVEQLGRKAAVPGRMRQGPLTLTYISTGW